MPVETEIRDKQRESWNKYARGWEKWDAVLMTWMKPVSDKIVELAQLKPSDKILDVATGTGEPGLTAAKKLTAGSVIGVDLSEAMLEVAKRKAAKAGLKNYSTEHYDGFHLPGGNYDAVLSRFGIMFLPDVAAGLKEFKRVAKPGAFVVAAVWNAPALNPWGAKATQAVFGVLGLPMPTADTPGMYRLATPGMAVDLFQQAGFKNIRSVSLDWHFTHASEAEYWECLNDIAQPIASNLATADAATKEKAKQATFQAVAPFKKPNGTVVFPMSALIISAEA